MKTIVLSDFTSSQLQAAEEQLQAAYRERLRQHAIEVERVRVANLALSEAPVTAWREGRYLAALVASLRSLSASPLAVPTAPAAPSWTRGMNVLAVGRSGERAVQTALAEVLPDAWVAVTGYKNPRGEVDLILIGPPGILALEIKAISGRVFCDGDTWWKDKYDRYQNLVETRLPIADQRGRSPSRQMNEPVDMLQAQLARRSISVPIARGVVLAHESSELGHFRNAKVQFVGLIADLRRYLLVDFMVRPAWDQHFVPRVTEVVCHDHAFHERRFAQRVGGTGGR